jgi:hypothetical protein
MVSENKRKTRVHAGLFGALALLLSLQPLHPASAGETGGSGFLDGFLYFADGSGKYLTPGEHRFPAGLSPHERAAAVLDALIQGPPQGLNRTLPGGTRVNALFIDDQGSAWVDLDGAITDALPGGTQPELLAVYSMVNSLTLNIPEIRRVKFLVQGSDAGTLSGHVDLGNFFRANMLIIR